MEGEFLDALQREHNSVAAELRLVTEELAPILQRRRELEQRARALETVLVTYGRPPASTGAYGQDGSTLRRGRDFLDVAWQILQAGGPLHYEALVARVGERGVPVPGRNPAANLVAHISRDRRFKRVSRGTYAAA